MSGFRLKLLLDEQLPRKSVFKYLNRHHNLLHVADTHLAGKDDPSVYFGAKKQGRVLVTLDKGFYESREFKYYNDTGIIYLKESGQSYSMSPSVIEERLTLLFKCLTKREFYYNVKIKVCHDHLIIRQPNARDDKIVF